MTTNEDDYYFQLGYEWGLKFRKFVRSAVTFAFAGTMIAGGAFFTLITIIALQFPDAVLLQQADDPSPASLSGTRIALAVFLAVFVVVTIRGWDRLKRWLRPHAEQQPERAADLEIQLRTAESRLWAFQQSAAEAEQRAAEAAQAAGEAEWMHEALASIADVFRIDGVLEAARRACRKALHPDSHPGASEQKIRELTESFQHAEEVFSHFQPN
jgi:hypothetical protein